MMEINNNIKIRTSKRINIIKGNYNLIKISYFL
jgi:hypothetical protein